MSCKDFWAKEVASRLAASARIAPGQVDGAQRCDHAGCTELVNRALQRCVKGHVQGGDQKQARYPAELRGLLCLLEEVVAQKPMPLSQAALDAVLFVDGDGYPYDGAEAYQRGCAHIEKVMAVIRAQGEGWQDDPRMQAAQMALASKPGPPRSRVAHDVLVLLDCDKMLQLDGSVNLGSDDERQRFWDTVLLGLADNTSLPEDSMRVGWESHLDTAGNAVVRLSVVYDARPGDQQSGRITDTVLDRTMPRQDRWTAPEIEELANRLSAEAKAKWDELRARRARAAGGLVITREDRLTEIKLTADAPMAVQVYHHRHSYGKTPRREPPLINWPSAPSGGTDAATAEQWAQAILAGAREAREQEAAEVRTAAYLEQRQEDDPLGRTFIMGSYSRPADPWSEDAAYPRENWQGEAGNGDTNLGYWEWVEHQREADDAPERPDQEGDVEGAYAYPEDPWGEDARYPRGDWQSEAGNGDTNLGYWEWVEHKMDSAAADEEVL